MSEVERNHASPTENGEPTEEEKKLSSLEAFGDYLTVDTSKELDDLSTIIDGILAKFEEFCTVIELIRMESKDLLFTTLPVLHERCSQLKPMFTQTDALEVFVAHVRKSVEDTEEKVRVAERELGKNRGINKILNTNPLTKFFSRSRSEVVKTSTAVATTGETKTPSYELPKTFSTDDFFTSRDEHQEEEEVERSDEQEDGNDLP